MGTREKTEDTVLHVGSKGRPGRGKSSHDYFSLLSEVRNKKLILRVLAQSVGGGSGGRGGIPNFKRDEKMSGK